jgi:CRP/FNR family transcriptional regulator, anaerobic regulatory protein
VRDDAASRFLSERLASIAPLPERALEATLGYFHVRRFTKGSLLVVAGETCERIHFLVEGVVGLALAARPDSLCDVYIEGDFVSDYPSFVSQTAATIDATALVEVRALTIDRRDLLDLYSRFVEAERLGRLIAERQVASLSERLGSFISMSAEERYEAVRRSRPELVTRIPQYLLARWLGVTPEALSRIRRRVTSRRKN